jgi:hypothetical protein
MIGWPDVGSMTIGKYQSIPAVIIRRRVGATRSAFVGIYNTR